MQPRSLRGLSCKPTAGRVSIALVGMDERGTEHCLHQAIRTLEGPRILTYSLPQIFLANPPAEWMDLLALCWRGQTESLTRLLSWARRRWPDALRIVISPPSRAVELATRAQGAMFFLPPMSKEHWQGLFAGVKQTRLARRTETA